MYGSTCATSLCSLLAAVLTACSVYDESLNRPRPATAAGSSSASAAGVGGNPVPPSAAGMSGNAAGAGGAGSGGQPSNDPLCGDGIVDAREKCDTGVLEGAPGACPFECSAPACATAVISGNGCQTECRVAPLECEDGDGCCPAACSAADDSDCSGMCGDGIVQSDLSETCEPGASEGRCPTAKDCDDGDACTADAVSGSPSNCNSSCTHTPIVNMQAGDGCCPAGANANTDGDCKPSCGNGVREGDEACDGSTGCDDGCRLSVTDVQAMCLDTLAKTECEDCQCLRCTDALLACSNSGDASRDQACTAVVRCSIEAGCVGDACYCGDAPYGPCAFRANGPCKSEIESAAGTTGFSQIRDQGDDPNSVLGRALALGACRRAQCAQECR